MRKNYIEKTKCGLNEKKTTWNYTELGGKEII